MKYSQAFWRKPSARKIAAIACGMVFITSCGSDLMTPGGGGTGTQETTLSVGPISGFGSVIINGVRYDDSSATVSTDSGISLLPSDLRLGMMVELRGSANTTTNIGIANSVTVFSEIKGVVESVSVNNIVVNGLTVNLVATTVFDNLSFPVVGDFVEIYGVFDPVNNSISATRIERKSIDNFKLRGVVSAWDSSNTQFVLGATLVDYGGATLPQGFGNGVSVRAYAAAAPSGSVWPVSGVRLIQVSSSSDGDRVEIEGVVDRFTSLSDFSINGLLIDASNAVFEDGSSQDLMAGRWVEAKGNIADGRLVATELEFEDGSGNSSSGGSDDSFEVTGVVENFVGLNSFSVRNTRIDASQSPEFDRGTAADLANGVCVEVKGDPVTDSLGTVIRATEVKFDDDCF
ncbi:MAG: DUF5666 domain-containing protein [Burkholderiaceae bacterium]